MKPPCLPGHADDRLWIGEAAESDPPERSWKSCLQLILAGDYLSPAVVSLLFSDLFGAPMGRGDRAVTLERSWEERYRAVTGKRTLAEAMTPLRNRIMEAHSADWMPLLLINGTSVSTGRRVIASDVQFESSTTGEACGTTAASGGAEVRNDAACFRLFKDAYDLRALLHRTNDQEGKTARTSKWCRNCEIRLSTAATVSARFPVISPHGVVRDTDGSVADRLVDGGYFENNGALTATDLAEALELLKDYQLTPWIIQITNEPTEGRSVCDFGELRQSKLPPPTPRGASAFSLLTSPIGALLNTTSARGTLASTHLCRYVTRGNEAGKFFQFEVRPQKGIFGDRTVSMSWWLSRNVQLHLDHQLDGDLAADQTALPTENLKNLQAFKTLFEKASLGADIKPPGADAVNRSIKFEDIADEYLKTFDTAKIRLDKQEIISAAVQTLVSNRSRYEGVERETGVPWYFVGLLHYMEAKFSFAKHLHNGDSLLNRTVQVPAGRPKVGEPPFTWEQSAIDALQLDGFDNQKDWDLARVLYRLERYNGFGYRKKFGTKTPYLWSFTDQFTAGIYVADGVFDPEAEATVAGAATLIKALIERGAIAVPR